MEIYSYKQNEHTYYRKKLARKREKISKYLTKVKPKLVIHYKYHKPITSLYKYKKKTSA